MACIFRIALPAALPSILTGVRIAIVIGCVVVFLSEMVAPEDGLGDAMIRAARSFDTADWVEVVLHFYRVRWGLAERDPSYASVEARLSDNPSIKVPTLVIHGGPRRGSSPPRPSQRPHCLAGAGGFELSDPETHGRPLEPKTSSQRRTDPLAIVTAEGTAMGDGSQAMAWPHDLP